MKLFKFISVGAFALVFSACSASGAGGLLGGLLGNINNGNLPGSACNPGTQVQLANPLPLQQGVNPGIGSITIVANGNSNYLYNNYNSFNVSLVDQFGNIIPGGQLQLVSYPNGPHPYNSDFYYSSSIGPLQAGMQYQALLTNVGYNPNTCSYTLQTFST